MKTSRPETVTTSRRTGVLLTVFTLLASVAILLLASCAGSLLPSSISGVQSALADGRLWFDGEAGGADGAIGEDDNISVFDTKHPAVTKLQPELREAVQQAAAAAQHDGVGFVVNGGWRSPAYQRSLLKDAVHEYGSAEEAAKWVAPPNLSSHVSGNAIDIGPFDAMYWLAQNGADFGLCQTYANEAWHFEFNADSPSTGCPEAYLDPTYDPRLRE